MENYITEFTPDMHGKNITCKINQRNITDAMVVYEKGKYYILQNFEFGGCPSDIRGYKASWCAGTGTKDRLKENGVSNILISNYSPEIY